MATLKGNLKIDRRGPGGEVRRTAKDCPVHIQTAGAVVSLNISRQDAEEGLTEHIAVEVGRDSSTQLVRQLCEHVSGVSMNDVSMILGLAELAYRMLEDSLDGRRLLERHRYITDKPFDEVKARLEQLFGVIYGYETLTVFDSTGQRKPRGMLRLVEATDDVAEQPAPQSKLNWPDEDDDWGN